METELTTAATDLVLALVCLIGIGLILRSGIRRTEGQRGAVWIGVFGLLGISGLLGAAVHGLALSPGQESFLWHPLYLALGGAVALFAAGVLIDLRGSPLPVRAIAGLLAAGVLFYGLTAVFSGAFIVFVVYEAAALLFALGGYLYLFRRDRERYSLWMAAGIAVSIAAAAVQAAGPYSLRIVREFDHNGLFHLVQVPGVILLLKGVLIPRNYPLGGDGSPASRAR
jgi:hypothetical protein